MIRVAYLSMEDPRSHHAWSGTHRRLLAALEAQDVEVVVIGPLRSRLAGLLRDYNRLARHLHLRPVSPYAIALANALLTRTQLRRQLAALRPDVLFAPAGALPASTLDDSPPLLYLSDATSRLLDGYYPDYTRLPAWLKRRLARAERTVIARADRLIYPTRWAADSAVRDYGADPARVHVLPFGPNFDQVPGPAAKTIIRSDDEVRLLFIGRDWSRKGGELAWQATLLLRARGVPARLIVCGCAPTHLDPACSDIIPDIDKHSAAGYARLAALYRSADIFLLPTRAECAGVVFSEAAAFGLPIVATATGGVGDMAQDGGNAILLPLDAAARDYARAIATLLDEPGRLREMREASLERAHEVLNWKVFGQGLQRIIHAMRSQPEP